MTPENVSEILIISKNHENICELRGMDSAMKDFASRASDMGVGLGTGADVAETMGKFSKADVQDRSRVITDLESQQKINKHMIYLEDEKMSLLKEQEQVLQKAHQIIQESLDEELARKILYSRLNSSNRFNLEELSEELNAREKEIKNIIKKLEDRFSVELI